MDPVGLVKRITEQESFDRHAGSRKLESLVPYIVGLWLDTFVMGIIMMLFGLWCWRTRPTERRIFRYLAYWLFFTCCVGSGWFVAHVMETMVRGFGEWIYIGSVKYIRWFGLISLSTRVPTVLFLLHRSWMVWDRKPWIIMIMSPFVIVTTSLNIASVVVLRTMEDAPLSRRLLGIAAAVEVTGNFTLAGSIAFKLDKMKSGFKGTDHLIERMNRNLIETQCPTAAWSAIFLIVCVAFPQSPLILLVMWYPKCGVLCTLIILNYRSALEARHKAGQFATKSATDPTHLLSSTSHGNSKKSWFGRGNKSSVMVGQQSTRTYPFGVNSGIGAGTVLEGPEGYASRVALTRPSVAESRRDIESRG